MLLIAMNFARQNNASPLNLLLNDSFSCFLLRFSKKQSKVVPTKLHLCSSEESFDLIILKLNLNLALDK